MRKMASPLVPEPRCKQCPLLKEVASKKRHFCNTECREEFRKAQKLARRPTDVHCAECNEPLDPLMKSPSAWRIYPIHFCDNICMAIYRERQGFFDNMSKKGHEAVQEY